MTCQHWVNLDIDNAVQAVAGSYKASYSIPDCNGIGIGNTIIRIAPTSASLEGPRCRNQQIQIHRTIAPILTRISSCVKPSSGK